MRMTKERKKLREMEVMESDREEGTAVRDRISVKTEL